MNDLLDFIKNPKDREDFFIAIIVIVLFGGALLYNIFPRSDYDASLTEQELADNLNQSLADGSLKSKIFTDLEDSDDLSAIKASKDNNLEKVTIKSKTDQSDYMTDSDDLEKPIISNQSKDNTNSELYNKSTDNINTKEEIAKAKKEEERKAAEALKMAEAKKEEERKAAEELKMAEAKKEEERKAAEALKMTEAKKEEERKAAEALKIAEAKKEEERKAAEANVKPSNQTSKPPEKKIGEQPATSEYDKKEENKTTKPATSKNTKPKAKPKASTPKKSGCVIVVGAFKQAEGVNLILKRLKADNYKTTTGYIRGLKYVGVPIKCDANNDKIIKELNDKYDKEAWVLRR